MTCDAVRDLLSALLEGELPAAERASVEEHLAACPECRELRDLMAGNRAALAAFPEALVSGELLARLCAVPDAQKPWYARLPRTLLPRLQPALAVLTAILVAVSMYAFHPNRKLIDRSIARQFHRAFSRVETLYVRAEGWTGSLGEMTSGVIDSVKSAGRSDGLGERSK
jgi:anti-sigma factor RsiW